jgi:thiamine pyrophosphokinase
VRISGLKYPLSGATLWNTHTLGVSNEFTGEAARISVEEGILLISYPDAAMAQGRGN